MAPCTVVEELKYELINTKRRLQEVNNENYLLKVKIRKLENDLSKKDKQIECLLDPTKTTCMRKIVSERGATMLINSNVRNKELEAALIVKDNIIRKLQSEINLSGIYKNKCNGNKHIPLKHGECNYESPICLRSRSLNITPVPQPNYERSSSDIEMKSIQLAQNLQAIKMANTLKQKRTPCVITSEIIKINSDSSISPGAGKGKNDIENKKYADYINEEMEKIKGMIKHLTREQEHTKKIMKDKNKKMEILSRKVKYLQKSKCVKNNFEPKSKIRSPEKESSEDKVSSSARSYSQDSFENDESSMNNKSEERCSDDDVETGESQ